MDMSSLTAHVADRKEHASAFALETPVSARLLPARNRLSAGSYRSRNERMKALCARVIAAAEIYSNQLEVLATVFIEKHQEGGNKSDH